MTLTMVSSASETGGWPTYLGLEPSGTLVFVHEPVAETQGGSTAVLVCPPFGWEEVCSSRSLRSAAALLAQAGHPTARLTLPGTGDGAGGPREGDLLRQWIEAVGAAATWLSERADAARCLAFGIGLGGMLAYLAAREYGAIDDLALWAVPDRGRTLLRETKNLSKVIASEFSEDHPPAPAAGGDLGLIGYLMTAETEAALAGLQLSAVPLAGCEQRRVLLLSRGAVAVDQRLRESFERHGADVEVLRATDYYTLMVKPEESQTPEATIAHVLGWLARGTPTAKSRSASPPRTPLPVRETPTLEIGDGILESPLVCSGCHGELFGIISRNRSTGRAPFALVLVGAGALPHTGPNRAWVDLARRWAARGIPTVRLDLAGIGEAGGDGPELMSDESQYESWRVADVRAVLDRLQAEGIAEHFALGGLCSGANCSLHGGLADPRVCGLLLLNLFLVTWSSELIGERARRPAVADGAPHPDAVSLDSPLERRQVAAAIAAFDRLNERGIDVLLLFGAQEALYRAFVRQGLIDQLDRWPNVRLERYQSGDQMFRAQWLQRHVHQRLDEALERMLARVCAARNRLLQEVSA